MTSALSSQAENPSGDIEGQKSAVIFTSQASSNGVVASDDVLPRTSNAIPELDEVTSGAIDAMDTERNMSVWEAVRLYRKAIAFNLIISLVLVMEGYDTALLRAFFGLPQFNQYFGVPAGNGDYQVPVLWQGLLMNGALIGEIIGLLLAGHNADRYGYKRTILGYLVLVTGCIFVVFFAQNVPMLFAGEVLCGIPWGAFSVLIPTYAAEIAPTALRPIVTTTGILGYVGGHFVALGALRGMVSHLDEWAWRIPVALQWMWPVPIIIAVVFAPESPWWYVRKGRLEDARKAQKCLTSSAVSGAEIDKTINMMIVTNEREKQVTAGTTYSDCFKGTNLRRTGITCAMFVMQVGSGVWFALHIVYFLEQAGVTPVEAFNFGLGTNALALCGVIASWYLMTQFGRRTLYVVGLASLFTILMVVGFMGIPAASSGIGHASGALLMLFILTFMLTVAPVCYCLSQEIPSTRLRVKTVALARNAHIVASIGANFLQPPILNPTAWNLRGRGAFIWAGLCFFSLVCAYFWLPESKGLAPAEIDSLFEQRVPARKFRKVQAQLFRSNTSEVVAEDEHRLVEENNSLQSGDSKSDNR